MLYFVGHGITKQEAKRNSAYLMNQQIHNIGINKLNEIKNSENKIMLPNVVFELKYINLV